MIGTHFYGNAVYQELKPGRLGKGLLRGFGQMSVAVIADSDEAER
jgi:hypothetical protein